MITLQHSLVYLSALAKDGVADLEKFKKGIPWTLLPDALRCYTGNREYTHFEESSTIDEDISWIEFPEDLKEVSKDNLPSMHLADGIQNAVIGETTHIDTFHEHNAEHSKYGPLRIHLEQDVILDNVIRELVDCRDKYNGSFKVNTTGEKIDGQELRRRIAAFEKYGFLHFAKNIYERTGILVNQQWFDENVREALEQTYSQDMTDSTYKYMKIDPEIERRIANQDFEFTKPDIEEIGLGENVEDVIEKMYQDALEITIEISEIEERTSILQQTKKHKDELNEKNARIAQLKKELSTLRGEKNQSKEEH